MSRQSVAMFVLLTALAGWSCGSSPSAPGTTTPSVLPSAPSQPPKPLEGVAITVTGRAFVVDPSSRFSIGALRIYQCARLTFTNADVVPHDILSDPPHIHSECPELNTAGYLVPGQSRTTDPIDRLVTCGFHDHTREGDPAFAGRVTIEPR